VIHLRSIGLDTAGDGFPFAVPAIRSIADTGGLAFETPITFFVGENGSGKSTLLEALAWACEAVTVGSRPIESDPTLQSVLPLGRALRLVWNRRPRRGFFLRAEDFFGYVNSLKQEIADLGRAAEAVRGERPELPEGELARIAAPYEGSAAALRQRYGEDMDGRSHGEQFLELLQSRLVPRGLYLLDEPEAPLSPQRQLALISLFMQAAAERDCQLVVATHSPLLMATPDATIWSFDEGAVQRVAWDELEHVRLVRDFLNRPESYLRHL
jgi:predicted ATPase